MNDVKWRCFHCDAVFSEHQERWAREHFGRSEGETPVCQMRVPGESHLITALRRAQDELASYRSEDTELMRAIESMEADYREKMLREEEKGYARGLKDYMAVEAERESLREQVARLRVRLERRLQTCHVRGICVDCERDRAVLAGTVPKETTAL